MRPDSPGALRVAFAGTPEFARTALAAIHAAGFELPLVLTQPDRPAGRGQKLQTSAVKRFALEQGLALAQPRSLRLDGKYPEDAAAALAALQRAAPDVMVVAAYGLILPRWVLVLPRHGCINIHGSLLPRWRGAAPIQRAIEAGDTETGITLMQMDEGLDTGAMLGVQLTPIQAGDTTGSLGERLAQMGAARIVQALHALRGAGLHGQAQPLEGVNYAHKISKSEALIDWSEPAAVVERRVRAFDPAPGCSFLLDGRTVKLWCTRLAAGQGAPGQLLGAPEGRLVMACGEGALELLELQWPGGRRIAAHEFLKRRNT